MKRKPKTIRKCRVCKARFTVKNPKSRREYCPGDACKQAAYRDRQRELIAKAREIVGKEAANAGS